MTIARFSTLAESQAAIADLLARGLQHDACAAALLLLGIHPKLDSEAPAKDRETESADLQKAILVTLARLATEDTGSLLRLRPAGDYRAEALRAGLPRIDKLNRLTEPLTPEGVLIASEWSLLGAATRLHCEDALGPLYVAISRDPSLFCSLRDAQGLMEEVNHAQGGIRTRGQHDPVNQWLPAFRDTRGGVHDVLDVGTGMVNAQAYFIPATIFAQKAMPTKFASACLALQSTRAHDVCEQVFSNDEKLFRGHLRSGHARLIVGQSLGLGASVCLSQSAWEGRKSDEKPRSFGAHLPNILASALTGTLYTFSDEEMAAALKRMHAQGHDVRGRSGDNKPLPIHDVVKMAMPIAARWLIDEGADVGSKVNGMSLKEMVKEGPEALELRAMISVAEAQGKVKKVLAKAMAATI